MSLSSKHIFLTGSVRVGKSTIIKKILDAFPDVKTGGFFTRWISAEPVYRSGLYIFPADRRTIDSLWFPPKSASGRDNILYPEKYLNEKNLIAAFDTANYKNKIVNKSVFDETGRSYLRKSKDAGLILADEIGIMEDNAYAFHDAVIEILNSDIPVLGVVRDKQGVLTDAVKSHPGSEIIEVTAANRDDIRNRLTALYADLFK